MAFAPIVTLIRANDTLVRSASAHFALKHRAGDIHRSLLFQIFNTVARRNVFLTHFDTAAVDVNNTLPYVKPGR